MAFGQRSGPRFRRKRLVFVTAGVLVVGIGAAVAGTVSTFSTSQSKTQSVATGTFVFTLADPAAPGAAAPFSVNISGMAPGDFGDRLVNLVNGGSINYASISVAVTAPTSSLLDTDATNGLTLGIDECSVAWTQASTSVGATCSGGTLTTRTASTAVPTLKSTGPSYTVGLAALSSGATSYLRFHYSLPSASSGTSGLTSVLSFNFTASQTTGVYH